MLVLLVVGEEFGQIFQGLRLPLAQQVRVNTMPRSDLWQGLFIFEKFENDGGFLSRCVVFADHGRSVP